MFLGLFLTTVLGPIYTICTFYANQIEIEDLFCENKDKPELNCKGHCYLQKQLKGTANQDLSQNQNKLKGQIFWSYAFENLVVPHVKKKNGHDQNRPYYFKNELYHLLLECKILDPPQA